MSASSQNNGGQKSRAYVTGIGAWALAFGCSVGWGSFVMPGTTFLPIAGPLGSALGIAIGALVMMVLGMNFHYLMNRFSGGGGTYTYTKHCFGYDSGFVSAWFLIITYIAVLWANATALPLIARTLLGSTFQFGFHYEIAGFHVYLGEILLSVVALFIGAVLCLRKKAALGVQIVMAILLFAGIVVCFVAAMGNGGGETVIDPPYSPNNTPFGGIFTIFALAPWAFVGFESISHSAGEAKYPLKKTFRIMVIALITGGLAYILLTLLATTSLPEGCSNWLDYIFHLGDYSGIQSQPTFNAAFTHMGSAGSVILGIASLCGIFTGIIGNYIALSRLLGSMSDDGMLPPYMGKKSEDGSPAGAILVIFLISLVLPFFGRTAISWIVDVTTVGATIAYAFASAAAWKTARKEKHKSGMVFGMAGIIISLLFALEFLIPNIISVTTLSTESYLILAAWGILGFFYFRLILRRDKERKWGRSIIAWVILLGLIIFTSSVWAVQSSQRVVDSEVDPIHTYYTEEYPYSGLEDDSPEAKEVLVSKLDNIDNSVLTSIWIQVALIVVALGILFSIYRQMQKREKEVEVEKALAEESSRAKTSFLSNMSHEIRTPMNAIIGLDNIALKNPDLQPKTREQLEKIGASAKHLLGLINDILDMSRIESGRMVLKNEEFSFREFLDQINIIINGQCVDKGLHYECNIVGHLHDFYFGDDMKLKQVLINILGNSVKFTEAPGNVTLTIQQIEEEEEQCKLQFVMADTGIGMDQEYIPKIFEAFTQEDATSTNKYGGSGLGMAITKNFVEMMNGNIQVESEKGVGSTFTVTVVLKASSRTELDEHGIALPSALRTIVVDDDPIACEHTQIVLHSIGIEAEVYSTATEALEVIRTAHEEGKDFRLLLTDYKMPDMNGLELTRRVHEFDEGRMAIIILTGYNWDIIEDDASSVGIDDIMAKPLFSDTLIRKLHQVFLNKDGTQFIVLPSEEVMEEDRSVLGGKRILMAEDVEQNAEILADLLELEDIIAEHARNGQMAVDMFSEKPAGYYDAILMDVRMPVLDGLSATRAIRALDHPDANLIPIIAMTANVFDEDVEKSLQAGMNAHLSKPIEPDHLYSALVKYISERQYVNDKES